MADYDALLMDVRGWIRSWPGAKTTINGRTPWRVTFQCTRRHGLITVYGDVTEDDRVLLWPVPEHEKDRLRSFWSSDKRSPQNYCGEFACAVPIPDGNILCDEHEAQHVNELIAPVTGLVCYRCAKNGRLRVVRAKFSTLHRLYLEAAQRRQHTAVLPG